MEAKIAQPKAYLFRFGFFTASNITGDPTFFGLPESSPETLKAPAILKSDEELSVLGYNVANEHAV